MSPLSVSMVQVNEKDSLIFVQDGHDSKNARKNVMIRMCRSTLKTPSICACGGINALNYVGEKDEEEEGKR